MEIIEGVHRVDEASANLAHSNVSLVTNGKGLTIIDTGTPGNAKKILAYVKKIGYQPSDVTTIVLTHFHMDHVGSVKDLKELLPNARVAVHEEEAVYVSGEKQMPKPRNILFRVASAFVKTAPFKLT
jgi:glyoxylase-like metal-dependent hydrolase (beta-lactamase superfamily II)